MRRNPPCPMALVCLALLLSPRAEAFCGFYVAKADASLFNHASQVVLARSQNRTVLTMANDYQGELTEFAVVVPVPTLLVKEQIHVGDPALLARLDAWSGPRLVEYFDPNPCDLLRDYAFAKRMSGAPTAAMPAMARRQSAASLGVKVEAEYTVGEYDIVILSATQSDGLETYLKQEGYRIPDKAAAALAPYIRQNMKFFVAKVNLKEQSRLGFKALRPLQMAYESEKFMLPIRLGMANASPGAAQDLLVYAITQKGRVESVNYRTVPLPTDQKVPLFVKDGFPEVYKAIFQRQWEKEDRRAIFTEYAWNSSWCDPCADPPLSQDELRGLGAFFLGEGGGAAGGAAILPRRPPFGPAAGQPFITRLHVRYDRDHFPEDLMFQETGDQANYQARYVLNHPATGDLSCAAAKDYWKSVDDRREVEASTLAALTGWSRDKVVAKMGAEAPGNATAKQSAGAGDGGEPWYKSLWK